MYSLFCRKRSYDYAMLTLPAFCVPGVESAKLQSKREAQLQWMREKGVRHLGTPGMRVEKPRSARPSLSCVPSAKIGNGAVSGAVHELVSNG